MSQFALSSLLLVTTFFCLFNKSSIPNNYKGKSIILCEPEFDYSIENCNQTVNFQATAPIPLNDPNLSFEWDFGDGSFSTGPIVQHTYNVLGGSTISYILTLTVANSNDSCSNQIQKSITMDELPHAALEDEDIFTPFVHCEGDTYTLVVINTSQTSSENIRQ